jgi:hypothetical protein
MERFCGAGCSAQDIREAKECFNSTKRGYTMPAFTFEKISPPADRGPVPPVANKKQRGVIIQMLDRFAEARVKLTLKKEKGVIARNRHRSPE